MRLQTKFVLEHGPGSSGGEELMMIQLAHVELGPSQQLDVLVVMRNHHDATAGLRLFEVVHEIPLVPHWRGIARGTGRNNDRGPMLPGC
jgi:hypothetical protein